VQTPEVVFQYQSYLEEEELEHHSFLPFSLTNDQYFPKTF
jgi:hypothetical protein